MRTAFLVYAAIYNLALIILCGVIVYLSIVYKMYGLLIFFFIPLLFIAIPKESHLVRCPKCNNIFECGKHHIDNEEKDND